MPVGRGGTLPGAGCGSYLTKPVKQSELFNALLNSLSITACDGNQTQIIKRQPALKNKKLHHILLAEDNAVNQRLAVRLLEKEGHSVVVANNGSEAVTAIEREAFDLILMDVQMPGMNGYEATAAIREKEILSGGHIPIIALTANAMKGDRERCLDAGMDGYASKPIKAKELIEAIETLFAPGSGDEAHYYPLPVEEPVDRPEIRY